jgi:arginine decarboxylase
MKINKHFWKLGEREFNTQYFDVTKDEELVVHEGNYQYKLIELVKKFGSPLEIVFPFILEERLEDLIDLFNSYIKTFKYRGKFFYHYPMKVNQNKEIVLPLVSEGANLETGSANELWLVKKLWEQGNFNTKIRIICNGPKTNQYLNLITELKSKGLEIIPIIEDLHEYKRLLEYKNGVGIRLSVQVPVSSHWQKKVDRFGILAPDILKLGKIRNLKILHYHIGSQIEKLNDIFKPIKEAMSLYVKLKKINPTLETLDIGGGMPIPYDREKRYTVNSLVPKIIKYLQKEADRAKISHPNIICEWGRYLVSPAQISIFKVLFEKNIPTGQTEKWYVIDGSFMNDLLDTWAIHQSWHIVPLTNLFTDNFDRVWLAGLSCDSDDKYTAHGNYVLLPSLSSLAPGESLYFAILDSGSYQDALASHHCLLSSPTKIIAQNGEVKIIRKRETPQEVGKIFGW